MNRRAFWMAALIAGLIMGLLGSLPLLNFVNCILCLWVWLGGILAVYLYRRNTPGGPPLTQGQGAGLGAVAGLFGALFGSLVFLVTGSLSAPLMERLARSLEVQSGGDVQTGGFAGVIVQTLIFLALDLVLYPLFGALAGLIGVSLLWKKPQA